MGKFKELTMSETEEPDQDHSQVVMKKFDKLKIGDELALRVSGRLRDTEVYSVEVTHVTKTRFKTQGPSGNKYEWTKDGHEYPCSDGWSRAYIGIDLMSEAVLEEIRNQQFAHKVKGIIESLTKQKFNTLKSLNPIDQVNALNYLELALTTIKNGEKI